MSKVMTRVVGGLAAISVASTLVTGSATSASADAGSAIAAGLFGGAAGMMLGAAIARPAPVVVYEPAPVYVKAPLRPVCHMVMKKLTFPRHSIAPRVTSPFLMSCFQKKNTTALFRWRRFALIPIRRKHSILFPQERSPCLRMRLRPLRRRTLNRSSR